MPETLLSPSNVLLYGRELNDLTIKHAEKPSAEEEIHRPFTIRRSDANRFLDRQVEDKDARLARIYGFSFEGCYYDLARPAIFLVHGKGEDAEPGATGRASIRPAETDLTGVAAQEYSYSEDIRVWSYDKGDYSIRLDIETGPLEEILLEAELMADEPAMSYSGAKVRGAKVRGAKVRGAKVRGAKVRGGRGGDWSD